MVGAIVRVYRRDTGALIGDGATGSDGNYSIEVSHTGICQVVCLYPTSDYADKILRTTPV